ncbi:hypothetical protein FXB38_02835 [Bradyrhizobium cytisi]|uniref:Uncharacterized protein n=1 Tax=Bradyrhizobium cytisi TaxID=515489 RepID=A0A5S4X413_9BRAD|nr:hypothetical protein FXB38_02835 [Bradyrhizobium cytisi]
MPGLVPGIHVLDAAEKVVDGRDKPGHDEAVTAKSDRADRGTSRTLLLSGACIRAQNQARLNP